MHSGPSINDVSSEGGVFLKGGFTAKGYLMKIGNKAYGWFLMTKNKNIEIIFVNCTQPKYSYIFVTLKL